MFLLFILSKLVTVKSFSKPKHFTWYIFYICCTTILISHFLNPTWHLACFISIWFGFSKVRLVFPCETVTSLNVCLKADEPNCTEPEFHSPSLIVCFCCSPLKKKLLIQISPNSPNLLNQMHLSFLESLTAWPWKRFTSSDKAAISLEFDYLVYVLFWNSNNLGLDLTQSVGRSRKQ